MSRFELTTMDGISQTVYASTFREAREDFAAAMPGMKIKSLVVTHYM